jgi:acetyl-CoA C-acetyltransferase
MMQTIYVVDGARTPFLKAQKGPGPFAASDLATQAGRALLLRQPFLPSDLDEVILGCAAASPDETNIGRVISLRLGCGHKVPGWTVMRNCASGMQALDSAIANIQRGRANLVLAGGVDALSHTPLFYPPAMVQWFSRLAAARSLAEKLKVFAQLSPAALFSPVIGIVRGLTDPVVGLMMGQTAENLAWKFGITRQEMDAFAVESHRRVAAAQDAGRLEEISPIVGADGTAYQQDDGLRRDSSMENLARLRPFFDPPYGAVTAGNSSQITDGAAWLIVGLGRGGRGMEAATAGAKSLIRNGPGSIRRKWGSARCMPQRRYCSATVWQLNDIDAWEINEAFAAQVIGCLACLE